MARAREHATIGAVAGVGTWFIWCELTGKKMAFWDFVAAGCIGVCFGLAPDLMEPALTPHHRQFFHSYAAAGLLAHANREIWRNPAIPNDRKIALGLCSAGYYSHLFADGLTPMGLPLI